MKILILNQVIVNQRVGEPLRGLSPKEPKIFSNIVGGNRLQVEHWKQETDPGKPKKTVRRKASLWECIGIWHRG